MVYTKKLQKNTKMMTIVLAKLILNHRKRALGYNLIVKVLNEKSTRQRKMFEVLFLGALERVILYH